ncbi:MAG TPA: phosphoglucosamine mutase [Opitutaceae bacterium]
MPKPTKRVYFGTDGIRGPYGGPVVNEDFFARLGKAAALWLKSRGGASGKVLIGRDTRSSGADLVRALGAGLQEGGAGAVSAGIVPTPAVSGAVVRSGALLGAVVTASHNPAGDNGVKFFGPDGGKLSDEEEAAIEALIEPASGTPRGVPADAEELPGEAILEAYVAAATRILPSESLKGWTIALDTANGATCNSSSAVLYRLGARLTCIGDAPDGTNINKGVGSEHPEGLAALVLASGARIGIAHDGDGDRCVLCDEKGCVLDGDEVLTILATHAMARGQLAGNTLVVTIQSNLGVDAAVKAAGARVVRTPVGDRYVAQGMRSEGASLGGESSGHIVCFDLGPTGDGLAAALKVIAVMTETGKPLSELRKALRKFPQASAGLTVREKKPVDSLPTLCAAMGKLEQSLGSSGRILVRYSGTESKIRFLVEGADDAIVGAGLQSLVEAARKDLDVL